MIRFIGVDPGKAGGIALVEENDPHTSVNAIAWKMPETERDVFDLLSELVARGDVRAAYIEKVASSPQMGVASAFTFGMGYGAIRMALIAANIPFELVAAGVWQRTMGCIMKGNTELGKNKNITKARAQQLFPDLKITHALADSLLIAEYGRRQELSQR